MWRPIHLMRPGRMSRAVTPNHDEQVSGFDSAVENLQVMDHLRVAVGSKDLQTGSLWQCQSINHLSLTRLLLPDVKTCDSVSLQPQTESDKYVLEHPSLCRRG